MASAPIPLTNVGSGYTIVTQVIPSSTAPTTAGQNSSQTLSPLQKFLKGEPKALGTVQIMHGLLMLMFGFMFVGISLTSFVLFGVPFCGSLLHIVAGILTISASNRLHPYAVKGAMTVNILGVITAAISIITLSVDLKFLQPLCYNYGCSDSYRNTNYPKGILGVLLVFSLLQLAISISISAFACKATCSNEPTEISTINNVAMNSLPVESPPAYREIKSESDNRR